MALSASQMSKLKGAVPGGAETRLLLVQDATLKKVLGPKSDILVAYSIKSNSNIAVIDILNSLHSGADVVSIGELQRALKVGIPPDKIVFSGVGKTQEEMVFGLDKNILQFNVESLEELIKLSEISISKGKECSVAIRINPDIEAGRHKNISTVVHGTKFCIDYNEAEKIYEYASNCNCKITTSIK